MPALLPLEEIPRAVRPIEKRRRSLNLPQQAIADIVGCCRATIQQSLHFPDSEVLTNVKRRRQHIERVIDAVEIVGYDDLQRFVDVHGHEAFLSDDLDVEDLPQLIASLPFPGQGDGHDTEPDGLTVGQDADASRET